MPNMTHASHRFANGQSTPPAPRWERQDEPQKENELGQSCHLYRYLCCGEQRLRQFWYIRAWSNDTGTGSTSIITNHQRHRVRSCRREAAPIGMHTGRFDDKHSTREARLCGKGGEEREAVPDDMPTGEFNDEHSTRRETRRCNKGEEETSIQTKTKRLGILLWHTRAILFT